MSVIFNPIWPVGLGSPALIDEADAGVIGPKFPDGFSPLSDSIRVTEDDPHIRFQFGDGYEQRQRIGLYVPLETVELSFIANERNDLPVLLSFLRTVGAATSFEMTIPGCTGRYWYRDEFSKEYLRGYYWKVNLKLRERRRL